MLFNAILVENDELSVGTLSLDIISDYTTRTRKEKGSTIKDHTNSEIN